MTIKDFPTQEVTAKKVLELTRQGVRFAVVGRTSIILFD